MQINKFIIGGINYNDEKIIELINIASNNNVLITASSGNEGPSYGTISFPGVLPNVLTIGSLSKENFLCINIPQEVLQC